MRRRSRLPAQSRRPRAGGEPAAAGPGHDRRVRACQDHGALPPGQAARRTARLGQRAQPVRPTATITSASTRAAARRVIKSWPKRLESCGRSSSGSARNDAPSVRCADACNATASLRGPANRPGTARWSGRDAQEPCLQGDGGLRQDALRASSNRSGSAHSAAAPSSPGVRSHGSIHHRKIKSSSKSPGW